jgi:mono/diheme cytochrome c family protein
MDGLPPISNEVAGHSLKFPFNVRRGVGVWKLLYFDPSPVVALDTADALLKRGQYLVEGPGHCGECHTSRNAMGGLKKQLWLAGAPNPEGRGTVPNITPHPDGTESWSTDDLVYAFESGFKPDFDAFAAQMAAVQEELARLPDEDRQAIAAYLKAIPPLPDAVKPAPQARN